MKEPVLRFYNPEEELEIQCDASDTGLGAVLMQAGQPIAYKSHAMTPAERNYAPIEKEMLAIAWSVEVFHQYTCGRNTKVSSDHKPLERIMVKALKDVPKRLQNMGMRLQNYDLTVVYRPGIEQYIADALSRSLPT